MELKAERLNQVKDKGISEARSIVDQFERQVPKAVQSAVESTDKIIRANPYYSILGAAAVGFLVGGALAMRVGRH